MLPEPIRITAGEAGILQSFPADYPWQGNKGGLLRESQTVLDQAEDDLLAALESQPSEVDDPTLDLAHRVDAAVTARDGRAMVIRWLLDPHAYLTGGATRYLTAAPGPADLLAAVRPRGG